MIARRASSEVGSRLPVEAAALIVYFHKVVSLYLNLVMAASPSANHHYAHTDT
jgi:hypothetical protein